MKPILQIESLSKKYLIGEKERYLSIRDVLANPFKGIVNKVKSRDRDDNWFWALNNVTFNVYPGESIGIIGKNGAGKSTLLKILSRITPPTKGNVICRGRIASLLEVGTGFHPELTGRENIFMNGSILGMRHSEIKSHLDEIIQFSGVERFIDTPLKKYSSGMQLRLAFAVAAHLEPEILIIDEVLAVGDAEFQKRCLGKMEQISKGGRTVLFVSHDITAIRALTHKCVLLENGYRISYDSTETVINTYIANESNRQNTSTVVGKNCELHSARLVDGYNNDISIYDISDTVNLEICLYKKKGEFLSFEFFLKDEKYNKIALSSLNHFESKLLPEPEGYYKCKICLEKISLASGKYYIDVAVSQPNIGWDLYAENAISFDILMCNPRKLSWDLKQEYKYGNIAWLLAEEPKFIINDYPASDK